MQVQRRNCIASESMVIGGGAVGKGEPDRNQPRTNKINNGRMNRPLLYVCTEGCIADGVCPAIVMGKCTNVHIKSE